MKTCQTCEQEPCTCTRPLNQPHLWVIQHCTRAGCRTAIRSRHGLTDTELVCKWCQATALHGSPYALYDTKLYPSKDAP